MRAQLRILSAWTLPISEVGKHRQEDTKGEEIKEASAVIRVKDFTFSKYDPVRYLAARQYQVRSAVPVSHPCT